jgi:hypothetical protein
MSNIQARAADLVGGSSTLLAGVDGSRTHRGPLCAARHRF